MKIYMVEMWNSEAGKWQQLYFNDPIHAARSMVDHQACGWTDCSISTINVL